MAEGKLRRTVRRGIALLLIPLSVLVIQFDIYLRKQAGLVDVGFVTISELLAYSAIAAAVLYLLASIVVELFSTVR